MEETHMIAFIERREGISDAHLQFIMQAETNAVQTSRQHLWDSGKRARVDRLVTRTTTDAGT